MGRDRFREFIVDFPNQDAGLLTASAEIDPTQTVRDVEQCEEGEPRPDLMGAGNEELQPPGDELGEHAEGQGLGEGRKKSRPKSAARKSKPKNRK